MQGSCNAVANDLNGLLAPIAPARVRGMLHSIPDPDGWYPALALGGSGEALGMVYEAQPHFTPADLARIDAYEDFDPAWPDASLYLRREVELLGGGSAQAYVWNRALPDGARPIVHGDFRRWLTEEGLEPFRALREARSET